MWSWTNSRLQTLLSTITNCQMRLLKISIRTITTTRVSTIITNWITRHRKLKLCTNKTVGKMEKWVKIKAKTTTIIKKVIRVTENMNKRMKRLTAKIGVFNRRNCQSWKMIRSNKNSHCLRKIFRSTPNCTKAFSKKHLNLHTNQRKCVQSSKNMGNATTPRSSFSSSMSCSKCTTLQQSLSYSNTTSNNWWVRQSCNGLILTANWKATCSTPKYSRKPSTCCRPPPNIHWNWMK